MSTTTSKFASVPGESSATLDASHASTTVPPQPASRSDAAGQRTPPTASYSIPASASLSPQKSRIGQQNQPRTLEEYKENDPGQKRQWADGMSDKFIGVIPATELIDLLPSARKEQKKIPAIVDKCKALFTASKKQLKQALNEDDTSKPLLEFLEKVFEEFPNATRPVVADTHNTYFKAVFKGEHDTRPDITTGRPGITLERITIEHWHWIHAGLVIELKFEIDIFDANGKIKDTAYAHDALTQLGKSARSLSVTHSGCHVYVIAVFKGRMTRILRFDRGGFIATEAFDWLTEKELLPKFFYRLYNAKPGHMVGDDDTVSVPPKKVKKALWKRLQGIEFYKNKFPTLEDATRNSLCIKAALFEEEIDDKGNVSRKSTVVDCLTFGPPLSTADGLFGRTTQVYRVILEEDLNDEGKPLTVRALKVRSHSEKIALSLMTDSWRQTCRRPEVDYYDAIAHYCTTNNESMDGMAQCLGSVDLADGGKGWDSNLHRTFLFGFKEFEHWERRHMRTLLTPVGGPLNKFGSAEILWDALCSAVHHLYLASLAGVLHRDVSEGNILLQELSPSKGFLLDWDYAEFTVDGLRRFHVAFPDADRIEASKKYHDVSKSLKEFTIRVPRVDLSAVTREPAHDLESVYWLLVWMILRHTQHGHPDGALACNKLFAKGVVAKVSWLQEPQFLSRLATEPLFKLEDLLRRLVAKQYPGDVSGQQRETITFDTVSQAFMDSAEVPFSEPEVPAIDYVVPSGIPAKNQIRQSQSQAQSGVGQSRGSKRTHANADLDEPIVSPSSGGDGEAGSESRNTKKSKTGHGRNDGGEERKEDKTEGTRRRSARHNNSVSKVAETVQGKRSGGKRNR
ncbi:Pkinase-fungal domain-containing protein [Favolaschia claudopus]|uniref:Pkinase-fungal domain-containing protein n=1 Tax=Favolaschia claudopus TaxID=2862362 RepID=A0AAW0DQX5_9AGAR